MIQSHSGKKHSQQTIIAVCQGRSSLDTRRSLCVEFDCRTGMTSPERSLQTHRFCLSCRQHSTTGKWLPGTHLCCVPGPSPVCSHFLSTLEHPKAVGAAPGPASQERLCCAHPLSPAPHPCLSWLLFGWTWGSASLRAALAALCSPSPTPLSWCSWSQFHYATFQSSWAICFHSPAFLSLSVFILLTPVPHSLHMACPSF